jgi:hypothetical protein
MMNWNDGTPAAPGVYAVDGSKHDLRRAWSPTHGWSAPWYCGDDDEIVARAMLRSAERDTVILWREVPAVDARLAA